MMIYKNSIYYIFFKLNNKPFPYITTKEYNLILNVFDVVSTIYDKNKSKDRKSFLNYPFVLKQVLIILGKVIVNTYPAEDPLEAEGTRTIMETEFAAALQKRKIIEVHHLNNTMLVYAF